eukprot:TRINITY_DN8868_c1_g1_i1.p1 TRINITY_DN8868_c1_g1~~TRINITY_DN8868_c1_g1_i1.p1  ORF type:complete len:395 (+),score=20.20 TRINITY_DN8868_c1_g1_i1:224-1408(+)
MATSPLSAVLTALACTQVAAQAHLIRVPAPRGPPPHLPWPVPHACDPAHCPPSVNTSRFWCVATSSKQCRAPADAAPVCPTDWLRCAGPGAPHVPPPVARLACGCGGHISTEADVLCTAPGPPPRACGLPDEDGQCASGLHRCFAYNIPRLVLKKWPSRQMFQTALAAVRAAAVVPVKAIHVISVCPRAVCPDSSANCPYSRAERWRRGCFNQSSFRAPPSGQVVFDIDIGISDESATAAAFARLLEAAAVAVNGSSPSKDLNSTPGAVQLRELGVIGAAMAPPPASVTAPVPSPTPSPSDANDVSVVLWVAGCAGVVTVLVGTAVAIKKLRFSTAVDFESSRLHRRPGMEGCLRRHAKGTVRIDSSSSESESPGPTCSYSRSSSSDSEPEMDL